MKKLAFLLIPFAALGCHHSEFDVTPAQVSKQTVRGGPPMDFDHLPPGAVKKELNIKKGDVMPDGSIADRDHHGFRVEFPEGAKVPGMPGGPAKGRRVIVEENAPVGKP